MGLKVLSALDTARTQYYHFKSIIIAGMGMFTDAYDLFCIPPIMSLIGRIYYDKNPPPLQPFDIPPMVTSATVAVALLGTVVGNLVLGCLGDVLGRRRIYGFSLAVMVLSSFGCGFSICTKRACILSSLAFFRFMLGVGIGGDYPVSATVMSEYANKKTRGAFIAAVFSMQGFGILASSMVTMVICAGFDHATGYTSPDEGTPESADLVWRIILMIGAVPAALTFYWRMRMPETARFTALVQHNLLQAARDMERVLDVPIISQITEETNSQVTIPSSTYPLFSKHFLSRHGRDLFACSMTWFLVDIVFYSSNLFQSRVYATYIPPNTHVNAYREAYNIAKLQAILAVCSTIPGYWATVLFIDRVGRVRIQIMGFLLMAICMFAIGIPYYKFWVNDNNNHLGVGFMILYGLTFFFSNFGPNTTTFIVPAELFPTRFRSTCHGISAAAGKIGALIGSIGFQWVSHWKKEHGYPKGIGMRTSLVILGCISLLGALVTWIYTPETMGRSLEENEKDGGNRVNSELSSFHDNLRIPSSLVT